MSKSRKQTKINKKLTDFRPERKSSHCCDRVKMPVQVADGIPEWCPLKEIHVKEQKNGLIQHGGFIEIDDSMKLEPISLDVFIDDLVRSAMNEKLKGDKDE